MPDYQYPGRLELKDIFDAYGKRDPKQEQYLARHAAKDAKPLANAGANVLATIEKPIVKQEYNVSKAASQVS